MQIAVVGGGFAGVATAWYLTIQGASVTLFDHQGIGGGASGVSTGLLHPFVGKKALRSSRAREGIEKTLSLVAVSEAALGRSVTGPKGLFRPALREEQVRDFQARSELDPEAIWQSMQIPGGEELPGLWIPEGRCLYSGLYLTGLWRACERRGALFRQEKVELLESLSSFDRIVIAAGDDFSSFSELASLPLKKTWGQVLVCRWEEPLPFSLSSDGHITASEIEGLCYVGSTYEHTPEPNKELAIALLDQVARFYPPAKEFPIVAIKSGIRVSPKNGYLPIVEEVRPHLWVFTGLGSRGLLYHALFAFELASKIVSR